MDTPWVRALIKQLGLVRKLSTRDHGVSARHVLDMGGALGEVSRVLKAGGRAVYVVGDWTVRATFVRNAEVVRAVAENHGLVLQERRSRALPANRRYLPPLKEGRIGFNRPPHAS
jgi:hypothetical protein